MVFISTIVRRWRIKSLARRTKSKISKKAIVGKDTKLEGNNLLAEGTNVCHSEIGFGTYIGKDSFIYHSKVGRFCSIAGNVSIINGFHPSNFASTYPGLYKPFLPYSFVDDEKTALAFEEEAFVEDSFHVVIGNDVWIGAHALIKAGIKIGNGSIIGMGAIVTKDVPPYAIVAGNPARIIRYRFDEETIRRFERLRWWELPLSSIKELVPLQNDPKLFLEALEKLRQE